MDNNNKLAIFTVVKWLTILLVALLLWVLLRGFVPASLQGHPTIVAFNRHVDTMLHLFSDDIPEISITTLDSQDITLMVQQFQTLGKQALVLYVYSLECSNCSRGLGVVNTLAEEYEGSPVSIIALAQNTEESALQSFLSGIPGGAHIKAVRLRPGDEAAFATQMQRRNINLQSIPYLVVIDAGGGVIPVDINNNSLTRLKELLEQHK